jgi:hypothetical protein
MAIVCYNIIRMSPTFDGTHACMETTFWTGTNLVPSGHWDHTLNIRDNMKQYFLQPTKLSL